jgi:hypothetical protein
MLLQKHRDQQSFEAKVGKKPKKISEPSGKISRDCYGWNGLEENQVAALEKNT